MIITIFNIFYIICFFYNFIFSFFIYKINLLRNNLKYTIRYR